jgi:hypothetical protein
MKTQGHVIRASIKTIDHLLCEDIWGLLDR